MAGESSGHALAWPAVAKVRVGDAAPDFELPGTGGRVYSLSAYRDGGVILAFYPGDFTPVCTRQFCSYRDDGDDLEALGVPMLGISPQSVESHERFSRENGLTIPLLSDRGRTVAGAYGVLGPGGFVRRSVFVIDGGGMVRYRHVSLLGLSYQRVADIAEAVATLH
jgi:thioredoxin-dependent peroxiredoxin